MPTPAPTAPGLFPHVFGGQLPIGVVFVAIVLGLWFTRRHSLAMFALLGLGSSVGVAFAMKALSNRPRPEL